MEYVAIGDKEEILDYEFLPAEARRQVKNHEALAVWAYDELTPVCCAVFTQKDIRNQMAVVLQYICTDEAYRNQGMARKLMEYSRELFKTKNISTAIAFTQGDEEDDPDKQEQDRLMKALGFVESIKAYQSLEYRGEVLDSDKLRPFMKGMDQHFVSLDAKMRRTLLRMDGQMETRLLYYFSDDTVQPESIAYVEGDSVRGAIILDEREEYRLCIRYLYIDPKFTDKTILLKLLAGVTSHNTRSGAQGNVLIIAPEERIAKLMEFFFGEPDKRYYRTMYLFN